MIPSWSVDFRWSLSFQDSPKINPKIPTQRGEGPHNNWHLHIAETEEITIKQVELICISHDEAISAHVIDSKSDKDFNNCKFYGKDHYQSKYPPKAELAQNVKKVDILLVCAAQKNPVRNETGPQNYTENKSPHNHTEW